MKRTVQSDYEYVSDPVAIFGADSGSGNSSAGFGGQKRNGPLAKS
jgi:hypothetical protein